MICYFKTVMCSEKNYEINIDRSISNNLYNQRIRKYVSVDNETGQ